MYSNMTTGSSCRKYRDVIRKTLLIKKNQQLHSRSQYLNDNEADPANGGLVNKANTSQFILSVNYCDICYMKLLICQMTEFV